MTETHQGLLTLWRYTTILFSNLSRENSIWR